MISFSGRETVFLLDTDGVLVTLPLIQVLMELIISQISTLREELFLFYRE